MDCCHCSFYIYIILLTTKYQKDTYVKGVKTKIRIIEDIYVQKRGIVATSTKQNG